MNLIGTRRNKKYNRNLFAYVRLHCKNFMNIMDESCSLTPPESPASKSDANMVKISPENSTIASFNCRSSTMLDYVTKFDGHLKTGELKKLLDDELLSKRNVIKLQGRILRTQYDILKHPVQVFSRTKSMFRTLKMTANGQNICHETQKLNIAFFRQELMQFLQMLKVTVQKMHLHKHDGTFPPYNLKSFLSELARNLKNLLLCVGRISDIPYFVLQKGTASDGTANNLMCYNLMHMWLDLWWSCTEVFHLINVICMSNDLVINTTLCNYLSQGSKSTFEQICLLILWDLCIIPLKNNVEFSFGLLETSPFICPCIKEFWVLLITIMDKRHYVYKEKSFWSNFHYIVCSIVESKKESCQNSNKRDHPVDAFFLPRSCVSTESPVEFCLWMINHVAQLYKSDIVGQCNQLKIVNSCYDVVKYLVELTLTSEQNVGKEKSLRNVLSFCVPLVRLWEPTGDILLPLTDFYLRYIDDTFSLPGLELRELTYMFKSSTCWTEHIRKILSYERYFASSKTSFELYLQILGIQMSKAGSDNTLWRQLKGRIYSKVSPKRLRDLSEIGLQNCFSIFLVIAHVAQVDEMSCKISEFIRIIETGSTSRKKQVIVCKAMFAVLSICHEKNLNLEEVSLKLVSIFDSACSEYKEKSNYSTQRADLLNLIFVYLESTCSMFESKSNLILSEHILVGKGFSSLLPACSTSDLHSALEVVLKLLTTFRNICSHCEDAVPHQPQHLNFLEAVFLYIYPFIEHDASLSISPPTRISDIAATLTALVNKLPQKISPNIPHIVEIFKTFGIRKNTNSLVMCQYLCLILSDVNLLENLQANISDIHITFMQSWIKCGISIDPPCVHMQELTKNLFQSDFNSMFPSLRQIPFHGEHDYLMIKIFRNFREFYQDSTSLAEKANMCRKFHVYFQHLPSQVALLIKSNISNSLLYHVYKVISHLFLYCSPLLYIKYKSDCVLPLLLDTLLWPHVIFRKEKDLIASLSSSAIKDHLLLFLQGLAKLDYQNDSYVQRKFKDLIVHYICQYTFPGNPLLEFGMSAVEESPNKDYTLLCLIINVIKDNFLSKNVSNSSYGAKYCSSILKMVHPEVKIVISGVLLPCLLEQLLLYDENRISHLKELSLMVFSFFQGDYYSTRKNVLVTKIQSLIDKHLPWSTTRVYKWLEYMVEIFPLLLPDLISYLTHTIESTEKKRGVGFDSVLRNGLIHLADKHWKQMNALPNPTEKVVTPT